jgi:hypothetical protein
MVAEIEPVENRSKIPFCAFLASRGAVGRARWHRVGGNPLRMVGLARIAGRSLHERLTHW